MASTQNVKREREVSLTLRGFACSPQDIERLIGVKAESFGTSGHPVKPGVSSVLKRSYVRFSVALPPTSQMNEMISAIIEHLGGVEHLAKVKEQVVPEYLEVNLLLPIKDSPEQEGGSISPLTISALQQLGASLSFGFINSAG